LRNCDLGTKLAIIALTRGSRGIVFNLVLLRCLRSGCYFVYVGVFVPWLSTVFSNKDALRILTPRNKFKCHQLVVLWQLLRNGKSCHKIQISPQT
jgi:hypothetical protein